MIEMNCPHCGHPLKIDDKYQGQRGKCKKCGKPISVPALEVAVAEPVLLDDIDAQRDKPSAAPPPRPYTQASRGINWKHIAITGVICLAVGGLCGMEYQKVRIGFAQSQTLNTMNTTTQPKTASALVGTGVKERILIGAMNFNMNLDPQYHHNFYQVYLDDADAQYAVYQDEYSTLILVATGPTDDLILLELMMPLDEFFAEENGEFTGEGGAAFGRCVQRLTAAVNPSWTNDLYNWMNQNMTQGVLDPDGVYMTRKDFVANFGTQTKEDGQMYVIMTIGRLSKTN